MNTTQLNAALLSHCPVVHMSAKYGAVRYSYVSGIITRYNKDLGRVETSVEVTDRSGNSVSVVDPAELNFWQPVPDEEKKEN